MTINDTSATIKLRWSETIVRSLEADVPVDQLPDQLIEVDGDSWSIVEGDVDSYVVNDFLDALDMAGSAIENGVAVENRYIEDSEVIPPIMVAAPPVSATLVMVAEDDYLGDLAERAEWREELREGNSL